MLKVERLLDRIPVVAERHRFILCTRFSQGVLPMWVGGATSQLDLPTQPSLSIAGYGRLQPGVAHWATSVALLFC